MPYRVIVVLLAFLATAAVDAADTVVEAPEVGFRLVIPDVGWTHAVERGQAGATSVTVGPADRGRGVQLSIRTTMVAARSDDATGTRDALIEYANAQPGIADVRRIEERIALRVAPGLSLEQESQGGVYRVRIAFLHADGIQYRMQFHAPKADFERLWPTARRILDGFELVAVDAEVRARQQLRAVAGRCGSQIDWAENWDAAAARARTERRLIAVGIHAQGGFELGNQLMEGVFTEPDIVALMQHRFVGMTWTHGEAAPFALPEVFGLSGTTFGVGILVCDPDGNVLRQIFLMQPALVIESLRQTLLDHGNLAPPPSVPAAATRAEHAAFLIDSGQLTAAARFLGAPAADESVAVAHQRVRLHRLQRRSEAALAALAVARVAPDAEVRRTALDLEEGWIRMGRGANGVARACLERAAAHGDAAERAEAAFGLGLLDWADGDRDEAGARWTELARAHPDEPAAWRAAAGAAGPALRIRRTVSLAWPEAAASAVATLPAPAVERFEAEDALADAVGWLAARQRADGGWDSPFGLRGSEPAPDPVATATQALAVLALARGSAVLDTTFSAATDPGVQAGVRRYLEDRALQRAYPSPVAFMDYTCWGSAYGVFGLLGLRELGCDDPAVTEELDLLVADLVRVQQGNGGWSYYQSATVDGASVGAAMSFTTATVLLALQSAREHGVDVPADVLGRGAACLRSLRGPGGNFQYSRMGDGPFRAGPVVPAGAAGRGPLCTLALARTGEDVTERWASSFRTYVEYLPTYGAQSRRALMHAGADGQGSHYLLYDYATAAEALRTAGGLDEALRAAVRTAILREMARCRSADGSFVDNPLIGQAAGTALAVLTLLELRRD